MVVINLDKNDIEKYPGYVAKAQVIENALRNINLKGVKDFLVLTEKTRTDVDNTWEQIKIFINKLDDGKYETLIKYNNTFICGRRSYPLKAKTSSNQISGNVIRDLKKVLSELNYN